VPRIVWRSRFKLRFDRASTALRFLSGGLGCLCALFASFAAAARVQDAVQLLQKADAVRTSNYEEFAAILQSVAQHAEDLPVAQLDHLRYLEAWKSAYDGDNETAISRLNALADRSNDVTLRLRAGATAVNVLQLARRYEDAFSRLNGVLDLLPQVADKGARQQSMLDAAQLYGEVGQYDLSLSYAQAVMDENGDGRGVCKGGRLKLVTLYDSGRLRSVGSELQSSVDACLKVGEINNANAVRVSAAKIYIGQSRFDDAIKMLQAHYGEVQASHNPRLISNYDALLADAYRKKGVPGLARQFAWNVTGSRVKEFNDQLVTAYRVLYEVAKQQGDFKAALAFHEDYAAADKAYLDDVSARHLAYQKVNHENIANKLQVEALNKQNHVLQLERALSAKAVETSRLYIGLLTMTIVFIALWAYRTKRSQLHFQSLSQMDGLTGICNRPYFIEQAEKVLENARKTGENVCIILCDLDHFKAINDKYGHATGDFVLKRTVLACKTHLGTTEIFGRFGGEEFGVLLPSCGPEEARQRAEQLRITIAGITAYQGATRANVSASFGVATTSSSGYDLGQLLAHADAALYEAKRAGRNRVVPHDALSHITPVTVVATTTGEFLQVASRSTG
jgi:diguanylate cyclase (GGDEF)-like protein